MDTPLPIQIVLKDIRSPSDLLIDIQTLLGIKEFDNARQLIEDYIYTIQQIIKQLQPTILEKFPLPLTSDGSKSPALLEVKNKKDGSSKNTIPFYLNGNLMCLLPFSTGTSPYACLDNFPTEIDFNGKTILCTFEFEGQITNSEAIFAAEKIKNEDVKVKIIREKFGNIPIIQDKDDTELISTRKVVLSLSKMEAKLAPRKLTCKDGFFTEEKLWDKKIRIWAMLRALMYKFDLRHTADGYFCPGDFLRTITFMTIGSAKPLIQEIQSNQDAWTALATDDSVGLLGATLEICSVLIESGIKWEQICPLDVLELMK